MTPSFQLLGSLLLLLSSAHLQTNAYFVLTGGPLVTERVDPISSPILVSAQVNTIVGGSSFGGNTTYNQSMASNCSSLPVQLDQSNYWAPQLYSFNAKNATYSAIEAYANIYYLTNPGSGNDSIKAFPAGLKMLAGNSTRRTYDSTSFAQQAISYGCLDYDNNHADDPAWVDGPTFPKHQCPDGLKAQVFFPSCWDGKNLYQEDGSHMAYPVQSYNAGDCPSSHPVHLVSLYYEFVYAVGEFPFNGPDAVNWVWSNGDVNGTTLYADFTEAWKSVNGTSVLQEAVDTCMFGSDGLADCAALQPYIDYNAASACRPSMPVVNEGVGFQAPLAALPGCNPLWTTAGPKPICPSPPPSATFMSPVSFLAGNYSSMGCVADGITGSLLTGPTLIAQNMTGGVCTEFCSGKKMQYAGVLNGDECYCGSTLSNGGTGLQLASSECGTNCAGRYTENCGSSDRLSLYVNPALAPASVNVPVQWSAMGCLAETQTGHSLSAYSIVDSGMTIAKCLNACASKAYTYGGVTQSNTCNCGNVLGNATVVATCDMTCAGAPDELCGGSAALSVYRFSPAASSSGSMSMSASGVARSSSASASASSVRSVSSASASSMRSVSASSSQSTARSSSAASSHASTPASARPSSSAAASSVKVSSASSGKASIAASGSMSPSSTKKSTRVSTTQSSTKMLTIVTNARPASLATAPASVNGTVTESSSSSYHIAPTMIHRRNSFGSHRVRH